MDLQTEFSVSLTAPAPAPATDGAGRLQLIFDVETLLLDPLPGMIDSVGWTMIERGLAPTSTEIEQAGVGRRPISQVLSALMETEDTCIVTEAVSRFHGHFNVSGRFRCSLREGALPLLQTLAKDPLVELHYLTHIGARSAHKLLEQYGLAHLPMNVVTLEHATCPGIRLPMMKFMVEQGAKGARRWTVLSDHPWELMAAHQVGIHSVGLAYGRCDLADLCALEPDAIAAEPAEILQLLKCMLPQAATLMAPAKSGFVH